MWGVWGRVGRVGRVSSSLHTSPPAPFIYLPLSWYTGTTRKGKPAKPSVTVLKAQHCSKIS